MRFPILFRVPAESSCYIRKLIAEDFLGFLRNQPMLELSLDASPDVDVMDPAPDGARHVEPCRSS